MNEIFVLLTVERAGVPETFRWTLAPEAPMTRAEVLDWALGQAPARYRDAAVLFFSAEPQAIVAAEDERRPS